MKIIYATANLEDTINVLMKDTYRKNKKGLLGKNGKQQDEFLKHYMQHTSSLEEVQRNLINDFFNIESFATSYTKSKEREQFLKYYNYYKSNVFLSSFTFLLDNNHSIKICETVGELVAMILNDNRPEDINNDSWEKLLSDIRSEINIEDYKNLADNIINNPSESIKENLVKYNNILNVTEIPVKIKFNHNRNEDTIVYNSDGTLILDEKRTLTPYYEFDCFKDFFTYMLLIELIQKDTFIKKCSNCGKYFYPRFRMDTIYCDNVSPQNPNKTCKDYRSQNNHTENIKSDEVMNLYQKLYTRKQKRASRHSDNLEYVKDFADFKNSTKEWKKAIKTGEKSENDYIEWLKSLDENK